MHNSRSITSLNEENTINTTLGLIIVALAAVFYCYEYLLRVAPSVMVNDLMLHYQINDFQLSSLTAYYYYIYAPMQLPVGLLVDRYGPKMLMVIACLSCAIGAYLFVCSDVLLIAKIGRFLVGFGSAFAFVGVLKLATMFLPKEYFPVVSGVTMALGQIGAMLGDVLLTSMINYDGWQMTSIHAAVFGLGLTLALAVAFRFAKQRATEAMQQEPTNMQEVFSRFRDLSCNLDLWKASAIGCLLWVPIVVFAEYLGIDYLKAAYGFTPEQAAYANAMIFIGMACGGPVVTSMSNYVQSRLLPIKIGSLISAVCICVVLYCQHLPTEILYLALFLTGLSTSTQVIVFPISEELANKASAGTAIAMTNMIVMVSGIIFQPLTGFLLNMTNSAVIATHSIEDYHFAFAYVPVMVLSAFFVAMVTKETHPAHNKSEQEAAICN